ncbi:glycosyltransferase family 4 protein [Frateuria sp. MAH-13]|uniref:Glycosyltransferase family 4 protein n=1 Tax=Frateuria flava TaxID=2821489 RepID=A0ABS4DQX7_9GAMM|nr:glycosyltransferase family 1 protein [Frateuria flava]MBP1475463.1 glycosyltransferase family 4 protein [Frateuria flava]
MRIVLDLQACQSPESRRRGIGRYSLALAKAMVRNARGHEITILLNDAMGDSVEHLRSQFDSLLPQQRLVTWEALAPTAFVNPENSFRLRASEVVRAQALRQLKPDVVHVASLFEGLADDVVATVQPGEEYLSAITLYDLIPLAHERTYLSDERVRRWYMEKVAHLRKADVLLGISRYTCDEAVQLLDVPRDRLTDISGAVDDIFVRMDDAEIFRQELMHRYGLQHSFVMYAGGFDARKNIGALIRAFALLPMSVRTTHQLVIVGGAPPTERETLNALIEELGLNGGEVVFAGYVPDSDLVKLYNLCALYVFPSLHEGFGLPALEAMSSGAIVIGSNTSSLPEVIGCAEALFDPRDDGSIAATMALALTDTNFRAKLREHGKKQCRRFSWEESAQRALDAFEFAVERRGRVHSFVVPCPESTNSRPAAFLPAPHSTIGCLLSGPVTTYADGDCAGVSAQRTLADFLRDRDSGAFDRIVLELANDVYCAKTLALAATGAVDIILRDQTFGAALQALASHDEGRKLVVALLYGSGGYHALQAAVDGMFSDELLGSLITPRSLTTLGRSQVFSGSSPIDRSGALAWRENARKSITGLIEAERAGAPSAEDWSNAVEALSTTMPVAGGTPQWLVDISNLAIHDAGTGIQRVVRHVLDELFASPPTGYRVEPVRLGDDGVFRYARNYCQGRYFKNEVLPPDEPVEFTPSDVYLGLDLVAHLIPAHIEVFRRLRNRGIRQHFIVYDLLPLFRPDCFEPHLLPLFRSWYEAVAEVADSVICISKAVADEFESWLHQARPARQRPLGVGWFHLGADLAPANAGQISDAEPPARLPELGDRPTFLMVGTVEPRKGHAQALAACELLWNEGVEVNLLVIGKPGWLVDDLLQRMAEHPQHGKRLFWFQKASDDLLLAAYRRASALIMASEGEGFGLPLIEGAHHGLPLIARDLPVFREIAAEHAHYFSGYDAEDLGGALRAWLELDARDRAPQSSGMRWNTWKDATAQLVDVLSNERWDHRWMPGSLRRYNAFDYRFLTQVGHLARGRMMSSGIAGQLLYGPYVPLRAGRYSVRIYGGGSGPALLDVCSSAGATIHAERAFVADDRRVGSMLVEVELPLDLDVTDLEVRISVEANTSIWVTQVEVAPVSGCSIAVGDRGGENTTV